MICASAVELHLGTPNLDDIAAIQTVAAVADRDAVDDRRVGPSKKERK
jgi:hypothetical protein